MPDFESTPIWDEIISSVTPPTEARPPDSRRLAWTAVPLPGLPDWTEQQADLTGPCGSCHRETTLRPDPLVGQLVCRPCWESLMFGHE